MRKIFLLLIFLLLFSCVAGCGSGGSSSKFNPPAWIQGEWWNEANEVKVWGFKFTKDDVIYLVSDPRFSIAFNETFKNDPSVNELKKAGIYIIEVPGAYYRFKKLSDITLELSFIAPEDTDDVCVLTKK